MVRCLVVDDEPNAHLVLNNYIRKTPDFVVEAHAYHVNEAKLLLKDMEFDLVFLDLNMPDYSGFDLIVSKDYGLPTILTTAYAEHALESYEYGVLDYLLKPFSYERFSKAIHRYTLPKLEADYATSSMVDMKIDGHIVSFPVEDILYLQSWGNYVKLFTQDKSFICTSTTSEAERRMPRNLFVRIHKSYVVNMLYVERFDIDYIILKNQTYLPVGITYRKLLSGLL
ncbi:LytR/AlgR family response regulator transcription factor [Sphingobacterium sp. LRF_L2]|uniref:LytR/AlgR family response regulator transcription factor n=1 Tax=Sphingobacterium sp. LRF_L2 TaxID=3369421 RepID=UPI003F5DBF75